MSIEDYQALLASLDGAALVGRVRDFDLVTRLAELPNVDDASAPDRFGAVSGHACHQAHLEPCAPLVARAMVRLVDTRTGPWALRVLMELASAAQPMLRPLGFRPARWPFGGRLPATTPAGMSRRALRERRARETLDALADGVDALAVASGTEQETRCLAIFLLGCVPAGGKSEHVLGSIVDGESPDRVRVQAQLALAAGHRPVDPTVIAKGENPLVDASVCALEVLASRDDVRSDDAEIASMLQLPTEEDEETYPWCGGAPSALLADALARSVIEEGRLTDLFLEALRGWTTHPEDMFDVPEGSVAEQIGERLFHRIFAQHLGRRDHLTSDDLTEGQRDLLSRLDGLDSVLTIFAPGACGIRNLFRDRERLVSRTNEGIEYRVEGVFVGERRVRWPIWKWWLEALGYDASAFPAEAGAAPSHAAMDVVAPILSAVPSAVRRTAVADAREGAYGIDASALAAIFEPPSTSEH